MQETVSDNHTPINSIKIGERFRKDLGDLKGLTDSIKEVGLLHPIVVSENHELIAGRRRLEACKRLGWEAIPVNKVPLKDLLRGEFHENAVRKDFTASEMVAIKRTLEPEIKAEHPQGKHSGGNLPHDKTRDIVAKYVGVSGRTLEKMEEIVDHGNKQELAELDSKSRVVSRVYNKMKRREDNNHSNFEPKKRLFDVWSIAAVDLEKPFGDPEYPGAIPGDIVANVLMWFLPEGGKVVDPMAGGGVTEDVCRSLGPKYEVLLYDNFSLPDYKYRESIKFNDITTKKLPEKANGADLIFVDPPYGPQKEYGTNPDGILSLIEALAEASYLALKPKGLVSVLMQNYYLEDECVGEFVPMIHKTVDIFVGKDEKGPHRFKQTFEATVPLYGKVARSEDHMTHIDRRLMVFKKEE